MQMRLHHMYQSYYEEDLWHRTPPIPTAFLQPPGSPEGALFNHTPPKRHYVAFLTTAPWGMHEN
jgi:hypothetical protein